jgi:methylmalonyl-CoA/ethylmalonyl-CoA epimerase
MRSVDIDVFGDEAEFDHIGVAVQSIGAVLPGEDIVTDDIQDVSVSFMRLHGLMVELVEPGDTDSPVSSMMKKGCKILHLCYRVPDIGVAVQNARKNGVHLIARPVPARAFGGRRIAWLFSKTLGLLELVEEPNL